MKYPTKEEVQAAYDALTEDGPGADVTMGLNMLVVMNPLLRETTAKKMKMVKAIVSTCDDLLLEGFITGLTVYGLNLGLRIGEARLQGLRTRSEVECLLKHYADGCEGSNSECRAEVTKILEWVLGKAAAKA